MKNRLKTKKRASLELDKGRAEHLDLAYSEINKVSFEQNLKILLSHYKTEA